MSDVLLEPARTGARQAFPDAARTSLPAGGPMSFAKIGAALLSTIANVSRFDRPLIAMAVRPCDPTGVRSVAHLPQPTSTAQPTNSSGGASLVTVVQAADFPECDYVTLGDAPHASGRWRVFRQREMSTRSVIVRKNSRSGLGANAARRVQPRGLGSRAGFAAVIFITSEQMAACVLGRRGRTHAERRVH